MKPFSYTMIKKASTSLTAWLLGYFCRYFCLPYIRVRLLTPHHQTPQFFSETNRNLVIPLASLPNKGLSNDGHHRRRLVCGCNAASPRIHTTPRACKVETGPLQRENSCQERNAFSCIEFVCQSSLQPLPQSSNPSTCSSATFSPALIQGSHASLLAHKAQFAQSSLPHCSDRCFSVDSWHCMFNFLHCAAS